MISLLLLIVVAAGVKALLGVARDPAFPLFSTSGTAQWIRYPPPPPPPTPPPPFGGAPVARKF
jgi:hypothetical protein